MGLRVITRLVVESAPEEEEDPQGRTPVGESRLSKSAVLSTTADLPDYANLPAGLRNSRKGLRELLVLQCRLA